MASILRDHYGTAAQPRNGNGPTPTLEAGPFRHVSAVGHDLSHDPLVDAQVLFGRVQRDLSVQLLAEPEIELA